MAKQHLTIGFFLEHYEPFTSGVITATRALKQELQSRGHQVYIICPRVSGFKDSDPDVIRYRGFSHPALQNTTIGLPLPADVRRLAKLKFDIVHSQEVYFSDGLGLAVARRLDIPFIQHYHTLWNRFLDHYRFPLYVYPVALALALFYYPWVFGLRATSQLLFGRTSHHYGRSLPARVMWRHMLNVGAQANLAISPSEHLIDSLRQANLKSPIEHLPNGIEPLPPSRKVSRSKNLKVLSVARLSPEKRVDVLIKAIAQTNNAQLDIIGIGPAEPNLKQLAAQLDLTDRVDFLGELPNEIVRQQMGQADVLALASYGFDNQPVVFIEALAAGLPIIYCDPNLKEGLTTNNSLLVTKSPAGFSQGFRRLRDKTKRQSMSKASRQQFPDFSISRAADKTLQLYQQAIDDFRRS